VADTLNDKGKQTIISVALPLNLASVFHYTHNTKIVAGAYVRVPLGRKIITGIVWDDVACNVDAHKLKPISEILDVPPLTNALMQTLQDVAEYNCATLGNCLKLALPVADIAHKKQSVTYYTTAPHLSASLKRTSKREAILSYCQQPRSLEDVRRAGYSAAVLHSLVAHSAVIKSDLAYDYAHKGPLYSKPPELSASQQEAMQRMQHYLSKPYPRIVLDGATGAGKTEIYFNCAEMMLTQGKQVLILLPEIALSLQILKRAAKRFGIEPTLWHSSLSPAARQQALLHIMYGGAQLIIGARSALFLPFKELGMIIVDEAHDASYKQDDGVLYHGRDMAVVRAAKEHIAVILATATPSCETIENIRQQRYDAVVLERRQGQAALPQIHLVEMQQHVLEKRHFVSPVIMDALHATLQASKQSLLFLNRRGYAPLMLCRACGYHHQCPHCSSWLVYHEARHMMQCHHCGHHAPPPAECPACQADKDQLILCGPGVERVREEVKQAFPDARVEVLSGDSKGLASLMQDMQRGEIDIAIGTQLLAKGHHFPTLEMVGIIDADAGLIGNDIRAAEKSYQLLHQLAGRAGRENTQGQVYLQTYKAEHPMMQALKAWDRDAFIEEELAMRKQASMPPYGRLAALIIEGTHEQLTSTIAVQFMHHAPQYHDVLVLGPAPAPMYKLRNYYRHRFLVRAARTIHLQKIMHLWRNAVKYPASVGVKIDIDPINFM
jgi:primosomal protein N' (replication factor Y) (superfamily II helicase)